jgi:prepilin-type processing-associated H-X9-DG protein
MVLGILTYILCLGPFAAVPAVVLGHIALNKIQRSPGSLTGGGMAITGLVLGYINFAILFLCLIIAPIMLPALARAREAARRSSCANNLKQMGLVYKMFSNESKGEYLPQLSPEPGKLMFMDQGEGMQYSVYTEYLIDLTILGCPSDVDVDWDAARDPRVWIDDESYYYLGYAVTNNLELQGFAEAYRRQMDAEGSFAEDLEVEDGMGSGGSATIYRLREGIERFLITDIHNPAASAVALSTIPLLIERRDSHIPGGGNVLFMDGHVEFIRQNAKWPMTDKAHVILESLDAMGGETRQ